MPFYLRKSVSVGPLRFNLSTSGVGVSAGIPGLRFGTGPRGNYVHMGRGGLYYRETLGGSPAPRSPLPAAAREVLTPIESGDVTAMRDSTSGALLDELNAKHGLWLRWPIAAVGGAIGATVVASNVGPAWGALLALATVAGALLLHQLDLARKTTVVLYDIEDEALAGVAAMLETCIPVVPQLNEP